MAMMDSSGWNPQGHQGLQPGPEDDFQQFLDIGSMGNLADGLQFDFQDFQNAGGPTLMSQAQREQMDTPMGGTDQPVVMQGSNSVVSNQITQMTTGASHPTIPTMMPTPLQAPSDPSILEIDAQIQYLQQQKLQHQQRQIHEQQTAAYFASQRPGVPPTPQSLEMQANNHQFYSPDHVAQQHAVYDNRFQRLKEQQDVCRPYPLPGSRQISADTSSRWHSHHLCHPQ
jgi:hypothetical protein